MSERPFYILSLDGGGSLGMYTLGVLKEVEKVLSRPLHETFDLVYGTSTGSIIGSMIALGEDIDAIADWYLKIVPDVMRRWLPGSKSRTLERWARKIYGEREFDAFTTGIGIVATHLEYNRPMVFKNHVGRHMAAREVSNPGLGA